MMFNSNKLFKTKAALAVLLSLSATSAFAVADKPFQHEAGAAYTANSENSGDGTWNLNYRHYFKAVDQDAPYALNGFLAQESNVGVNYLNNNTFDMDSYGIDGTFVLDSNVFLGAAYQKSSVGNFDSSVYALEAGYYFNDTSSASVFYGDSDVDGADSVYGLNARSYLPMQSTAGIDFSGTWAHSSSVDQFDLGADWYINKAWSVGAGYNYANFDHDSDSVFDLRTAYWLRISDNFSADFAVSKVLDSDYDGFDFGVGVVGRF